jgi:hypothetical protein
MEQMSLAEQLQAQKEAMNKKAEEQESNPNATPAPPQPPKPKDPKYMTLAE